MNINKPLFISVAALVLSGSVYAKPASAEITATVSDTLIIMREEEKVARDTYRVLSAQWELGIFENISKAEQKHMNVIGKLLEKYGIVDPVTNDTTGVFVNEDLKSIYESLLERGLMSSMDALQVGAFVEEFDLRDLQQAISETTEVDLIKVYENLMQASRNHLRAFVSRIEAQGVVYKAQVLSTEEIDTIVSSGMERGNNNSLDGLNEQPEDNNGGQDTHNFDIDDMKNDHDQSGNTDQGAGNMNDEQDQNNDSHDAADSEDDHKDKMKDDLDNDNVDSENDHEDKMKDDHDNDNAGSENDHEDKMKGDHDNDNADSEDDHEDKMKKAEKEREEAKKKAQEKRENARKNAKKQNKFNKAKGQFRNSSRGRRLRIDRRG